MEPEVTDRIRKIALEEHFSTPGFQAYSKSFTQHIAPEVLADLGARLADFDELRLAEMDRAGIDYTILSQTGPSVQGEHDSAVAVSRARESNDYLAAQIARHPSRFGGFATLAMHSPGAAVEELTRTVDTLGFKGALVNGHTFGTYYDDRAYDPFWARLQELDVPLYLHPTDAYVMPRVFDGHPELAGAAWGWGVETGTHALRLLFGGVFDRFPRVKLILGHMGEGLPFLRWRFDSRFAVYSHGVTLARRPSEYFGRNILITTSGVCSAPALVGAIGEMGADAVMFSVDYPYESTAAAADFIERAPLDDTTRQRVCHGNAARIFKL
ncbi:amidohydrolase [Burkholderia sp. Bp9017]|uniref:Amidohydrolase n=1 Tax=Burkholderia anthina TaxID=179879 RepID=A0A7T7AJH4_9BURK|nr:MULTISPECIES: amidohydrolase family protein [Burkholderia]MBY4868274.1 amidohydrolase family protein [Burkholderia anthina]QQK04632.1 amidohydrolase [Burkholderia anthina]RQZ21953.1 amidohydrolase [Burkholderia sp. Bp9017]RQZ30325.1 amidohydrolase [Burkholderia sp. Bp9016]